MRRKVLKISCAWMAAIALVGAVPEVAYAHGHHSSGHHTEVEYASCYVDGVCQGDGCCDADGVCEYGGTCVKQTKKAKSSRRYYTVCKRLTGGHCR